MGNRRKMAAVTSVSNLVTCGKKVGQIGPVRFLRLRPTLFDFSINILPIRLFTIFFPSDPGHAHYREFLTPRRVPERRPAALTLSLPLSLPLGLCL